MLRLLLKFILFTLVSGKHLLSDKKLTSGKNTDIIYFPFQVSITENGKYICGGAILQRNFIISAAHCFKSDDVKLYKVRAGSSNHNTGGNVFPVKEIVKHNLHELLLNEKRLYDIAIVQIKGMSSTFNKFIQPIGLPPKNFAIPYTAKGTLVGWGRIGENGPLSDVLKYVNIKIWKQSECKKVFGNRKIKDVVFCSGSDGKSACFGDSGGPFIVNNKLIGIVSWGKACGRAGHPTVFTNVVSLLPWIEATLNYLKLSQ